jgi:hypothetical protein
VNDDELCGIEFFSRQHYEEFLAVNSTLRRTTTLTAGNNVIILMRMADFPTRDVRDLFDTEGRAIGKLIGPDALQWTYQIQLAEPGEDSQKF